jgi:hypothetical protein
MKMKRVHPSLLLLAILIGALCGCAKKPDHLEEIIRYQSDTIGARGMTKMEYLPLVKPYSIWDTRPQQIPEVKWRGESVQSRYVPDILWGYVGTRALKLPKEEIIPYPQDFVRNAHRQAAIYIMDARADPKGIDHLVSLVQQSTNTLFVWQDWLRTNAFKRVNDVFRQEDRYWRYVIPEGSPYPMSSQIEVLEDFSFSFHDGLVFNACERVGIYCIVKREDHVVLMKGGMTANSCGYIWAKSKPTDQMLGHLFHLCRVDPITSNLYYYVSNGPG